MKNLIKILSSILVLIPISAKVFSQDLTASVPNTNLLPQKSGVSQTVTVTVTNSSSTNTYSQVSIDKSFSFFPIDGWISIDNNSQTIGPNSSIKFTLTINPTPGSEQGLFAKVLYVNAYFNNVLNTFNGPTLNIIHDDSAPTNPAITSLSAGVRNVNLSWSQSVDDISNYYTDVSKYNVGIKNYVATIKNNGTIIEQNSSISPFAFTYYFTSNVIPNTTYTVSIKAIDIAGNNSAEASQSITTIVDVPSNLSYTSTFSSATLSWTAPQGGASGYYIYKPDGTKVSTNSTSCTIDNLCPNSSYTFQISSYNSFGESSKVPIAVQTSSLALTGPNIICSSGTFTINNLPSGSTVSWSSSSNLTYVSGQNTNSYVVSANGNGSGWLQAIVSGACGSVTLPQYVVWVGVPSTPSITCPTTINVRQIKFASASSNNASSYNWWTSYNLIDISSQEFNSIEIEGSYPGTERLYCQTNNSCGYSSSSYKTITVVGLGSLVLSPNPTSSTVEIYLNDSTSTTPVTSATTYTVTVTNIYGLPVLSTQKTGNRFTLSIAGLKDGIYIVNVRNGEKLYQKQLVVKH